MLHKGSQPGREHEGRARSVRTRQDEATVEDGKEREEAGVEGKDGQSNGNVHLPRLGVKTPAWKKSQGRERTQNRASHAHNSCILRCGARRSVGRSLRARARVCSYIPVGGCVGGCVRARANLYSREGTPLE